MELIDPVMRLWIACVHVMTTNDVFVRDQVGLKLFCPFDCIMSADAVVVLLPHTHSHKSFDD